MSIKISLKLHVIVHVGQDKLLMLSLIVTVRLSSQIVVLGLAM